MTAISIQKRSSNTNGFRAHCQSLDNIGSAANTSIDHDLDFLEEVGAEGADFVKDVYRGGCVVCLATSVVGL